MMTGVIWFVQVVHYPLFKYQDTSQFSHIEKKHIRLTGYVVMPLMLMELITAALLFWLFPFTLIIQLNLILLLIIWASTFSLQMPLHRQLSLQKDQKNITKLIRTNWIRTSCWSLRSILWLNFMIQYFIK
jgi:hypothetical protein